MRKTFWWNLQALIESLLNVINRNAFYPGYVVRCWNSYQQTRKCLYKLYTLVSDYYWTSKLHFTQLLDRIRKTVVVSNNISSVMFVLYNVLHCLIARQMGVNHKRNNGPVPLFGCFLEIFFQRISTQQEDSTRLLRHLPVSKCWG